MAEFEKAEWGIPYTKKFERTPDGFKASFACNRNMALVSALMLASLGVAGVAEAQYGGSGNFAAQFDQSDALFAFACLVAGALLGALFSDRAKGFRRVLWWLIGVLLVVLGFLYSWTIADIALFLVAFAVAFGATEYFLITGGPFRSTEKAVAAPVKSPANVVSFHPRSSPAASPMVPEASGPVPRWLAWLNHYRVDVQVPPVNEDPALSAGDEAHARYLVANYGDAIARGEHPGGEIHSEKPGMLAYSEAGLKAASASDVAQWAGHGGAGFTAETAIDGWMSIPFHRLPLLNPRLKRAGYGQFCGSGNCAAALNVLTDPDPIHPFSTLFKDPIEFPSEGSTVALKTAGPESPDPLTACPGYALPTGSPITLQLGSWYQPALTAYSLKRDGAEVAACGFDANSYMNPDPSVQNIGRTGLRDYGAVIVIPREPLVAGSTYAVTMTVEGKPYRWSFKVD